MFCQLNRVPIQRAGHSCQPQNKHPPNWRHASARTQRRVATNALSTSQDDDRVDTQALLKYALAIPSQTGIMSGALFVLGQAQHALEATQGLPGGLDGADAAKSLVTLFFAVVALRSRIFSPLPADRPTLDKEAKARAGKGGLRRPDWCPPPITFPIVWTTVGVLRCVSSVMVWEACGRDTLAWQLVVMMAHLATGDCWNHINVVEQRAGVAVPGVLMCLASAVGVTAAYWTADTAAGQLLAPSAIWISIASALIYSIWDINGRPGRLFPTVGESRRIAARDVDSA